MKRTFIHLMYHGEVFTVEESDGYQTIYPAALSEYAGIFGTEQEAYEDLIATAASLGLQLVEVQS